jgi:hypothetical protein
MSHTRKLTTKMSQGLFITRSGKKGFREDLQMLEYQRELEKEKEVLETNNEELINRISDMQKESIKLKSIMSERIVDLEDQIKRMKASHIQTIDTLKEEYAKDLIKVSKITKEREQNLINNIK